MGQKKKRKTGYPTEFPYIDMRFFFIVLAAVFSFLVFYEAPSQGISLLTLTIPIVVFFGAGFFFVFRYAGKNVLALRPDHVDIIGGLTIPCENIREVVVSRRYALFHFTDEKGRARQRMVHFMTIGLAVKHLVAPSLEAYLEERGIPVVLA